MSAKPIDSLNIHPQPRVLVVDDDPDLLRLLTIRLKAAGYEVAGAGGGEQALSMLPTFRPQVLLTDLRMDGMDGLALFDTVSRRHPTLPVIILTAHGTIPEAVDATRRGIFGFLTKPFDARLLVEQIDAAVRLRAPDAPDVAAATWRADIITRSSAMEEVLSQARRVAEGDASIYIHGDSGTGKELLARAIHRAGRRARGPFLALNCAAIPENLLESELFGHVKGAFTGAVNSNKGMFVAASGGTLFLDEIGDMPLSFQAKLLRVLQERQVRPVGATQNIAVDVRIICASHRDLEVEIRNREFREDLYYRLCVVTLHLPSLAERPEDILLLADYFLTTLSKRYGYEDLRFAPEALELLVQAPWPGNVRQLYNVVEQVVALSTGTVIPSLLVGRALRGEPQDIPSLEEARNDFERDYLVRLLRLTRGNVAHAARLAKRNRTEFYRLLHRHHLDPVQFKDEMG
ncbi:DNA-binding transcriptional activator GlrR [Gammaproteobacteria bacterium]